MKGNSVFCRVRSVMICGVVLLGVGCTKAAQQPPEDRWEGAWLDESYGDRALAWVETHNAATLTRLESEPAFARNREQAAAILTDPFRLPEAEAIDDVMYSYWQDADHPLGIWRRTSPDAYLSGQPQWHTLLDLDALSAKEKRKWIFAGADCRERRCLVSLADNGKDAHEVREFDLDAEDFVDGGFALPEDKSSVWWYDAETLLVSTSAGGGKVNESRLPSTIRLWRRGTDLEDAEILFEIDEQDASVEADLIREGDAEGFVAIRRPDFFTQELWYVELDGEQWSLPLPPRAELKGTHEGLLLLRLNQDWSTPDGAAVFRAGALVSISFPELVTQRQIADAQLLYQPAVNEAVRTVIAEEDGGDVFVELLRDYRSAIVKATISPAGWDTETLAVAEDRFISLLDARDEGLLLKVEGPLAPEKLVLFQPEDGSQRTVFARPPAFADSNLVSRILHTRSRDGTRITYTVVHDRAMEADGRNPTLVYGYGGFDVAITPRYEPIFGKLWMEKGGVYVHAYLRGGGENGPRWHQSAMLENRQLPYDDMISVVEDLQQRNITSPAHTGIMGRSNGGLMVANVMMQRPDLMNAVVVGGPLVDMLTYHLIPPGATWTAEYGDPRDADTRAFIEGYSPLQQLDADQNYPAPLIITSTDDDRVLPGHARRFAAALAKFGHDRFYYEDRQGGHYWELAGGPAPGDSRMRSTARAVEFSYLARQLMNGVTRDIGSTDD